MAKVIYEGWAKPDSEIYKSGYVIGGQRLTPAPDPIPSENVEQANMPISFDDLMKRRPEAILTPEQARKLGIPESVMVISPAPRAKKPGNSKKARPDNPEKT